MVAILTVDTIPAINLTYPLNDTVFANKEEFKKAVNQVKSKQLTIEDIQSKIDYKILSFYSAMYNFFNGPKLNQDDIIYKDSIHSFIESNYNHPMYWAFFSILKNNGLIGVCARGYTFDYKTGAKEEDTGTTTDTTILETLKTETTYTAFNRTFSTYQEAEAYCISCDFDPDFITSDKPITDIKEECTLYGNTFNSYNEALRYAYGKDINPIMIHYANSPITAEQLYILEREYQSDKYKMPLHNVTLFLSHLLTLPASKAVHERTVSLYSLKQRHTDIAQRQKEKEQLWTFLASEIERMTNELQSRGVEKIEMGYMTKYVYKGINIFHFMSGETLNGLYSKVLSAYNSINKA